MKHLIEIIKKTKGNNFKVRLLGNTMKGIDRGSIFYLTQLELKRFKVNE